MTSDDQHTRDALTRRAAGLTSGVLAVLGREAARVPLFAVTAGLEAWQRTNGVRSFALRRGNELLQIAAHTPIGRWLPQPELADSARVDAEAGRIATAAREATPLRSVPTPALKPAKATPPAKAAAPAKARPPKAAIEAGAPGAVADKVEQIADKVDVDAPTDRHDLPIPDFDNVSLGSLRARLRSLSVEQLVVLREWEQAHAHRLPVVTLLDNRIAKLGTQTVSSTPAYPVDAATGTEPAPRS
jgi:hypothetical protein